MVDVQYNMSLRVEKHLEYDEIEEILGDTPTSTGSIGSTEKIDESREPNYNVEISCKSKYQRPVGPRINYNRTTSESSVIPTNKGKNSRRSRNGFGRGLPKKGGAGGKGTWGKLGSEVLEEDTGVLDPNDPNYDEQLGNNIKLSLLAPSSNPLSDEDICIRVRNLLVEYLEHGDTYDMVLSLQELPFDCQKSLEDVKTSSQKSLIVVTAVEIGMDRRPSHREMISVLLAEFYGEVLNEEDYEEGYDQLIRNLDDLVIDTPSAATLLGNFIARSVADDCIPPRFIKSYMGQLENVHGAVCLAHAQALLSMPHGLVRLDAVWGLGGPCRPVKTLVKKMGLLLREYLDSSDISEAQRCLVELEVPHFHHQLVYEALILILESHKDHKRTKSLVVKLLTSLHSACIVTDTQMRDGFLRVFENMAQIVLDAPLAYTQLGCIVAECLAEKIITHELAKQIPTRNRRRFVSEGGADSR